MRWSLEILEIARTIVSSLENKKGENIILIDLKDIAIFADYFVICSGSTDRMIQALVDSAIDQVKKEFRINARVEGQSEDGWMLVDYGDIILHIFSPQRRDYYRLEELWSEGKVLLHVQ
jgi:ribosome-associated protein